MSNKNYGKYYNEEKNNNEEVVETVETSVEETVEAPVEEVETVAEETMETPVAETEPAIEVVAEIKGVVSNCGRLNVRKKPNAESDAIAVIPVGAEVFIDMDASTEDFYKVNVNGRDGFCMKKYITIK